MMLLSSSVVLVWERTEVLGAMLLCSCFTIHTVNIGSSIIERASISTKSNVGTHNQFYYLGLISIFYYHLSSYFSSLNL